MSAGADTHLRSAAWRNVRHVFMSARQYRESLERAVESLPCWSVQLETRQAFRQWDQVDVGMIDRADGTAIRAHPMFKDVNGGPILVFEIPNQQVHHRFVFCVRCSRKRRRA